MPSRGLWVPKVSGRLAHGVGLLAGTGWGGVGWAMADPGFLGDGSGPAEAQTGDRGWSRFGSASPDGDCELVWREGFEERPRSTPDGGNTTTFLRP